MRTKGHQSITDQAPAPAFPNRGHDRRTPQTTLKKPDLKTKLKLTQTPYYFIIVKSKDNVNIYFDYFALFYNFFVLFFTFLHFYIIFFQLMLPSHKLSH